MKQRPLIILTGPTAVGKTELSIELAKRVNGEIISADSMQVYRHMDIGTAKITPTEMEGIPHYLVDVLDPEEEFNVVRFQQMAKEAIEAIYAKGKVPIVVGGTGFYIQALLYDIDFEENEKDMSYRHALEELLKEQGVDVLHEMLEKVDPQSAIDIHKNNAKKVIRALEFYEQTGKRMSEHNEEQKEKQSAYDSAYFVLTHDRDVLYDRINKRIDKMEDAGLIEEVRELMKRDGFDRSLVSMQGLGYKEIIAYLEGEMTLEDALYLLKRDTRHFAKRQLTWFRRERDVIFIDKSKLIDTTSQLHAMIEELKEKEIISN